jgi:carbonic anhydrase
MPAAKAWAQLMEGNARFVAGDPVPRDLVAGRAALVEAQAPRAATLSCSDSRVVPELIFDQGPGDLFVTRVGGNILTPALLASLEFSVAFLGVRLIVVMGHSGCGALSAVVRMLEAGELPPGHIAELVREIEPAVQRAREESQGDLLENVCAENVRQQVARLKAAPLIVGDGQGQEAMEIIGATYDLATGKVSVLDPPFLDSP